tara:strand:- start:115 stop:1041 length:927 start_codon:yes stop_codon:yes gene_type:complete
MKKEFYIGFTTILAGALLWFGVKFLSGDNNPFKQDKNFFAFYYDLAGLEVSDNVYYKGSVVGQVTDIRLSNKSDKLDCFTDGWIVQVSIDNDGVLEKIKQNTVLEIYDSDLLGSKGIKIVTTINDYKSKIECFKEGLNQAKPGDYLNSYVDKGLTSEFAEQFGNVKDELSLFLITFSETLSELKKLSGTVETILITNESNINSFMINLSDLSTNLSKNAQKLNHIVDNLVVFSDDLSDLELKHTTQKLNTALGELEVLLDNVNNGEGTVSKIIQDKDLYDSINKTLDSVRSLMEDIEKNPKKYIKHVL